MKILVAGFAVFVIWCVLSAWVYNDKLRPVMSAPEPITAIPEKTTAADSLAKIYASMPKKLSVYFEFSKTDFNSDQQQDSRIADFKAWLDKYPKSMLYVSGHTDLIGNEAYNQDLGLKRASVVGRYIQEKGIGIDRMLIESKGESEPAGDYLTSEGRAKNRRTEISIKLE
jgi:OmpA-OmpF porin, OOP family